MNKVHVLGVFDAAAKAAAAAHTFRLDRSGDVTVYAPAFDHGIDAALGPGKSRVRVYTLVGGVLGCAVGFAFPIYTALD